MPAQPGGSRPSLRVVRVSGKGRGVVAGCHLRAGEVVDAAPVIVIPAREWQLVAGTVLGRFSFAWDEGTGSMALALGRASLFNHSYAPNVAAEKRVSTRHIVFAALRDIGTGEELTLNYHGDPDCRDPLGFDVKDP